MSVVMIMMMIVRRRLEKGDEDTKNDRIENINIVPRREPARNAFTLRRGLLDITINLPSVR